MLVATLGQRNMHLLASPHCLEFKRVMMSNVIPREVANIV